MHLKPDQESIMISKIQQFRNNYSCSTSQGDEDYVYNMCHARRGTALIINNKKFRRQTYMADREGTDADAEKLEGTFKGLGFTVIRCDNQTCDQMALEMKKGWLHIGPEQNDCRFADSIFKCIFVNEKLSNLISIEVCSTWTDW